MSAVCRKRDVSIRAISSPRTRGGPRYLCPAPISQELAIELRELAIAAFAAIGAVDVARVDFRLGTQGEPYLLEINTLPGLNPTLSDIVMEAEGGGVDYETLILEILACALRRYGQESPSRAAA